MFRSKNTVYHHGVCLFVTFQPAIASSKPAICKLWQA